MNAHTCLYARLYESKRHLMVSCPICFTSLACQKIDGSFGGSWLEARISKDQREWFTREETKAP